VLPDGGAELVVEVDVDFVVVVDVVVVDFVEVVLVVVVVGCADVVLVVVGVTVVVGAAGEVPRDGVAEQVLTCRPAVRDARPS
jgi:hypothetical protein